MENFHCFYLIGGIDMAGFISSRSSTNFKLIKGELTGTTNEAVEWLNDSTLSDHYVINN